MSTPFKVAVVGDVHLHFNHHDVAFFNASDYDALLFVGDLINYRGAAIRDVTSSLRQLSLPSFIIPGNHDCGNVFQLVAEFFKMTSFAASPALGKRAMRRTSNQRLARCNSPAILGIL